VGYAQSVPAQMWAGTSGCSSPPYACIVICIYIHMYVYVYIYRSVCIYLYSHIYVYAHTHVLIGQGEPTQQPASARASAPASLATSAAVSRSTFLPEPLPLVASLYTARCNGRILVCCDAAARRRCATKRKPAPRGPVLGRCGHVVGRCGRRCEASRGTPGYSRVPWGTLGYSGVLWVIWGILWYSMVLWWYPECSGVLWGT
jgi:hypothetical protein